MPTAHDETVFHFIFPNSQAFLRVCHARAQPMMSRRRWDWPERLCELRCCYTVGKVSQAIPGSSLYAQNAHSAFMNNVWSEQIIFAYIQAQCLSCEARAREGSAQTFVQCAGVRRCAHRGTLPPVYIYNFGRYLFCYILNNNIFGKPNSIRSSQQTVASLKACNNIFPHSSSLLSTIFFYIFVYGVRLNRS